MLINEKLAVDPIPDAGQWTDRLKRMSSQPLEYCPQFPQIARRFEAWWQQALLDRPILITSANTMPQRPILRRLELLDQPQQWLDARRQDMLQKHYVADALPHVRVDFGPVMLGGLFGGRVDFGSDTTWTHAFIEDDWSNAPDWSLREEHPWLAWMWKLMDLVAADAPGRYVVCTPDLGGSADVLLNLRGSTGLCMDVLEQPEVVKRAIDAIYPAWRKLYLELYRRTVLRDAPLMHWLGVWSDRPYMIPACDFNFMISPDAFERICLPDIERQAATAGRAVFHLDGSGAARHIDALLEVKQIQAIQFTPGTGTPSALAWVDMFRKIQSRGRSLLVICPEDEVLQLCEALRPEGLAILVPDLPTADTADTLFRAFASRYGGREG